MAKPIKYGKALDFERNRQNKWQVELWEADETPLELAGSDVVRVRIWNGTDEATPFVLVESDDSPNDNGSTIVVDDVGDDSSTDDPATVTITIDPLDAAEVPVDAADVITYLEITVARAAASDDEAVCHRCVLKVKGSPA